MTSDNDIDTWHCNATCHTQGLDTCHFFFKNLKKFKKFKKIKKSQTDMWHVD